MVPREVKKVKVYVFILLFIMANVRLKGDERKVFTVQLY